MSLKDLLTTCHQLLSEGHKAFMITTGTGVPPRQIVVILPQTGFSPNDLWCRLADDKWHFPSSQVSNSCHHKLNPILPLLHKPRISVICFSSGPDITARVPSSLLSKCQLQPSTWKASNGLFLSQQALQFPQNSVQHLHKCNYTGRTCPPVYTVEPSGLKAHCKVLCVGHFYLCPAAVLRNERQRERFPTAVHLFCFTRCFFTALRFPAANIILQLKAVKDQ